MLVYLYHGKRSSESENASSESKTQVQSRKTCNDGEATSDDNDDQHGNTNNNETRNNIIGISWLKLLFHCVCTFDVSIIPLCVAAP